MTEEARSAAQGLDIIREEPCGDERPHEAHVFSYGPMHYQCPGEQQSRMESGQGPGSKGVEPSKRGVGYHSEGLGVASAAPAPANPSPAQRSDKLSQASDCEAEFAALADDALQLCDQHISDEVRRETQRRIVERVQRWEADHAK